MARAVPVLPQGHGEVLTSPPFESWPELMRSNSKAASRWEFTVGGRSARELREMGKRDTLARARAFSTRLGVPLRRVESPEHVILAGHQPEFFHPGVWIKVFLLDRLAEETGAAAVDLVVDSDAFGDLGITAPCVDGGLSRRSERLAKGGRRSCYACEPTPSAAAVDSFCDAVDSHLATLPTWALRRHFADFCTALSDAREDARNIAEMVTFARRRYESMAGTGYLELPVTEQSRTRAYAMFVSHLVRNAERFVTGYNSELRSFRSATKTRSEAQPFPDLETGDGLVEMPLWSVAGDRREVVRVRLGDRPELLDDSGSVLAVMGDSPEEDAEAVSGILEPLAPKAAALTMFSRMFGSDLFVHGVGGGRYDRVTDGIIRKFFGVEPPRFVVASMTMYLPLGGHLVSETELSDVEQALHRLEHNPDQMLGEVEFDSSEERADVESLAEEKRRLVDAIQTADADKKALGARIREVNARLASLLEPLAEELRRERERLAEMRAATEVITDRSYPFCFWSPLEVQDKAR